MTTQNLRTRPYESDDQASETEGLDKNTSAAPPSKRAKASQSDLAVFISLGLPIDEALTKSYTFFSPLPSSDPSDEYVLGVDEAGRGPVLGPMVYATCFCKETYYDELSSLGFADSKQLTEEQRDRLFARLQQPDVREGSGWSIRCISPQDISLCMLRRNKYNLNALAHDATIELLRDTLAKGVNVRRVFIDTVGPPATYQKKLEGLFPGIKITVAKKADSLYPIVSAASICAKVTRDAHLLNWTFAESKLQNKLSTVYGSGYPGDPNTIKWLRESLDLVFGYPGIIRFSWSTCVKILEDKAVPVTWADDEEASTNAKRASKFFTQTQGARNPGRPRSQFFGRRRPIDLGVTL
ncbi:hypothetical protein GGI15_004711 [Coemansia interrupta]|uniref:Ribonuclease n=1 Tax=Coemansia interrupta TaxID=1126814 RepID=A0A9W8H1H5_9FUNG|nr:hypothetical protein GGI15_004711 [Coemansia interrupta]